MAQDRVTYLLDHGYIIDINYDQVRFNIQKWTASKK